MTVPDYQSLMLPLLQYAGDDLEHSVAEARAALADRLGLSESDRTELLPSGRQGKFANRVAWAKVYLGQAGLLDTPRRAHFRLSPAGRQVLEAPPERITVKFLEQFPKFVEFRERRKAGAEGDSSDEDSVTPEEAIEAAAEKMRGSLGADLLARVKAGTPEFFERLVVELLLNMGYGGSREDAGEAIGKSGDEGIDGVITEDRLGLDVVYLQAKKWEGAVGRPEIQKFVGALQGKRARKGVFITTGAFSAGAREYVGRIEPKVVLIDGKRLTQLMIDFDPGVSTFATHHVKRVDSDYFDES